MGALLAATILIGACGGDDAPRAGPAPTATTSPRTLSITDPAPGVRVRGRFVGPARVAARVAVSGEAAPGATILFSGDCVASGCRGVARAGDDGSWTAAVRVEAPARRPVATVQVSDTARGRDERLRVRLRVPPRPAVALDPEPEPELPAVTRSDPPRTLIVIGDSLAQGTEPLLPGLLGGWDVRQDAERSRPLAAGMRILAATAVPDEPVVLAFSLFTNDDPRAVDALEAAVRTSVERAGEDGCAVWATIVRPPFAGVSYRAANERLLSLSFEPALSGRLLVVPWADAVAARPQWLAADGVHATPEGYRGRAQMYADAARSCGS